jgi:hypothetical protein
MITAIGVGTDPTITYFRDQAADRGVPIRFVDLFDVVDGDFELHVGHPGLSWVRDPRGAVTTLDPDGAFYCRLINLGDVIPAEFPEWSSTIFALTAWLELASGLVVNRPGHPCDNACKPLHETVLAQWGFHVPDSITSSDGQALAAFAAEAPCVAKALSGQRADCIRVDPPTFADFDPRRGPVHLQRHVDGDDVRAHVVGERVFAVEINANGDDYRLDHNACFTSINLGPATDTALIEATQAMGLSFAGWDLRVNGDELWVLEANPMPGYSYYDTNMGGRITAGLIEFLFERSPTPP